MIIEGIKNKILKTTKEVVRELWGEEPKELSLGFPPDVALGDFCVECFKLAKPLGKSPQEIAQEIAQKIELDSVIEEVRAVGPYINFKISKKLLFETVCKQILKQGQNFGNSNTGKGKRVMVEYLSPNTNKPLHLGHIRNGVLGMAIIRLLEAAGYKVIKASMINDRGVHICKSMLAWQKWGKGKTPAEEGVKGDHFVGAWYVRYNKEAQTSPRIKVQLKKEVQELLRKWERGDPQVLKLWKKMNSWVYKGFSQTYEKLGLEFDTFYYESKTYKLGKKLVEQGLANKVFYKTKEGAVVVDLPRDEFGEDSEGNPKKVTLLRPDGTSLYITQDLGTAKLKFEQYKLARSLYITGSEQVYHFKCLFRILELLGLKRAKNCFHLPYAMVYLPEGKMKSREGKIVEADELLEAMENLALEELKKRGLEKELTQKEIRRRIQAVGRGAIKFYFLRVSPQQDIHFDPRQSISFDGSTGPYCQYAYARICSIFRKARKGKTRSLKDIDFSLLGNEEEVSLARKLLQFPEGLSLALMQYNPSRIATYIYEIAGIFNSFYQKHSVLKAESKELAKARLALIKATAIILKRGLGILGLEALEKM